MTSFSIPFISNRLPPVNQPVYYLDEDDNPDNRKGQPKKYALGVAITVLSLAAYVAPFFVAFPLAASIQIVALGVLSATIYGIIDHQFACRQCIEYFTVFNVAFHEPLLKTTDATLNGIVWGIQKTWKQGCVNGVLLWFAARATKLIALSALSLTPFSLAGIALGLIYVHIRSERVMALNMTAAKQRRGLQAVIKRSDLSHLYLLLLGLAMAIGSIAARLFLTFF